MFRRLVIAVVVLVATATFVRPAVAEGDEAARQKYKDALRLHDDGKCDQALPMFREVAERLNSPNARLYVGRCLHQLGRVAEAYDALTVALEEATQRAQTEERYAKTRDAALAERGIVAIKVGLLTIQVPKQPPGLVVSLNGEAIELRRLGKPLAVEPGEQVVSALAAGHERFERNVTLSGGGAETVTVELTASQTSPDDEPLPDETAPTTGGEVRIAGFFVAGLGVAGWATFAISGLLAQDKYDTTYEACGGQHCTDPAYSDDISTGRTLETVANVGLVIGIVGVLAGSAMIVFGGPTSGGDQAETASAWTFEAGPTGGRVRVRF